MFLTATIQLCCEVQKPLQKPPKALHKQGSGYLQKQAAQGPWFFGLCCRGFWQQQLWGLESNYFTYTLDNRANLIFCISKIKLVIYDRKKPLIRKFERHFKHTLKIKSLHKSCFKNFKKHSRETNANSKSDKLRYISFNNKFQIAPRPTHWKT